MSRISYLVSHILVVGCWLLVVSGFAQKNMSAPKNSTAAYDTVILMTGKSIATRIIDTALYGVKIHSDKKNKDMVLPGDDVYKIKFKNGTERIVYKQDTVEGNEFTVEEAARYVQGLQDADKYFKPNGAFWLGMGIGAGSGLPGSVLGLLPAVGYGAVCAIPKIKIKPERASPGADIYDPSYIDGYEKNARKKRLWRAFAGGITGFALGITSYQLFIK